MKKKKMNEGDSPNQIIFIKYKEEKKHEKSTDSRDNYNREEENRYDRERTYL